MAFEIERVPVEVQRAPIEIQRVPHEIQRLPKPMKTYRKSMVSRALGSLWAAFEIVREPLGGLWNPKGAS